MNSHGEANLDPEVVVLSGWHSGPNPSPGLGTANAIRLMWPNAEIHALDYSTSASGMHSDIISERHILPSWEHADLDTISGVIKGLVTEHSALFISGLDLETHLLAKGQPSGLTSILVPPENALIAVQKPSRLAADFMSIKVPRRRSPSRHGYRDDGPENEEDRQPDG